MSPNIIGTPRLPLALLVALCVPGIAQTRTVGLVNPDPVTINCSLSPEQMQ